MLEFYVADSCVAPERTNLSSTEWALPLFVRALSTFDYVGDPRRFKLKSPLETRWDTVVKRLQRRLLTCILKPKDFYLSAALAACLSEIRP